MNVKRKAKFIEILVKLGKSKSMLKRRLLAKIERESAILDPKSKSKLPILEPKQTKLKPTLNAKQKAQFRKISVILNPKSSELSAKLAKKKEKGTKLAKLEQKSKSKLNPTLKAKQEANLEDNLDYNQKEAFQDGKHIEALLIKFQKLLQS